VLFTLLGQGTTIQFLLKKLGLIERSEHQTAHEMHLGKLFAAQVGLSRLEDWRRQGLLTEDLWEGMRRDYQQIQKQLAEDWDYLFLQHPQLEREMLLRARREALRAERGALADALRRGLLSDYVYEELRTDIDYRLEALKILQSVTRNDEEH
jgi:CPA1 family monovalent cation:H+ antiporter